MGQGRGRGAEGTLAACGGICCFVLFVVAAGLVGGSFKILEPLEYGLLQNTVTKDVTTDRVYTGGRFFVGLAKDLIRFPRNRRTMVFAARGDAAAITANANNGNVKVDCSLSYSLNYTNLVPLFRAFGTNYHGRFVSLISSALRTTYASGVFNSTDFYNNRAEVSALSLAAAQEALRFGGGREYATVHDFQLRQVDLPDQTDLLIRDFLVSTQKAFTAANVQEQTQINARINVIVGEINQDIELYQASQTQIATIITQNADATAKQRKLNSASVGYTAFSQVLGFNNTELLKYLYLKNARNAPEKVRLSVGFDTTNLWAPAR